MSSCITFCLMCHINHIVTTNRTKSSLELLQIHEATHEHHHVGLSLWTLEVPLAVAPRCIWPCCTPITNVTRSLGCHKLSNYYFCAMFMRCLASLVGIEFFYTVHRRHHNTCTLIPMNTCANPTPRASSKTKSAILKIDEVTTGVSLSTGTSLTTERTNIVKSWENSLSRGVKPRTWDASPSASRNRVGANYLNIWIRW
jgi:hypothetical protein